MKAGAGKAKGSAFERLCCQQLSIWVSGGKDRDLFWRSAMSGGRATLSARKGQELRRQAGDITAVAPEGHVLTDTYYVECKTYKDLAIDSFLVSNTGPLNKFWETTAREARKHKKHPLLIAKQNQMPALVLTSFTLDRHGGPYRPIFIRYDPNVIAYRLDNMLLSKFDLRGI